MSSKICYIAPASLQTKLIDDHGPTISVWAFCCVYLTTRERGLVFWVGPHSMKVSSYWRVTVNYTAARGAPTAPPPVSNPVIYVWQVVTDIYLSCLWQTGDDKSRGTWFFLYRNYRNCRNQRWTTTTTKGLELCHWSCKCRRLSPVINRGKIRGSSSVPTRIRRVRRVDRDAGHFDEYTKYINNWKKYFAHCNSNFSTEYK